MQILNVIIFKGLEFTVYKGECGDDVDPMPFLVPTEKERLDAMNKPYDIKRSCWVKDEKEAFIAGEIQSEDGDKVTVKTTKNKIGRASCTEFKEYFDKKDLGDLKVAFNESGSGPSDHSAFYNDSIPCLFFFTGAHQDYHTPEDDTEKIDSQGIATVANLIADVLRHFDSHQGPLTFHRTKGGGGGPRQMAVSLGIMPDFVSQVKGLGVDGVTPDKPAERAGILKGDVIIRIDERPIGDIYDYMNALQRYRKGSSCRLELVRGADTLVVTVEFK